MAIFLSRIKRALNVGSKSITNNGTYYASADGYDGYDEVTVNVSGGSATPITPSNANPVALSSGVAVEPTANGYAIQSYDNITPPSSPQAISSGDILKMIGNGYVIDTYSTATPSDSTPPQLSQGGIYIPTSNGYLYENQQGGSIEPDQVETYKNVANNGTKTITVSQMPKYITYFHTYYSSTNGGMFLILDVANNTAYRYGYWGNAFHNEDYTSGYSSYITSVSASSVTIKNAYGSAGNIAIGIYY